TRCASTAWERDAYRDRHFQCLSLHPFRATYKVGVAAGDPHRERSAWERDFGLALPGKRGRDRDGARPRRLGLPHTALPDPGHEAARAVRARDLDVGAAGKARMRFQQRPDALDLSRVAHDDGVRVSDRDRYELDPLEPLRRADLDRSQLLFDQLAADPRPRHPLTDADLHLVGAASLGEPAGDDPRPVARQLGAG